MQPRISFCRGSNGGEAVYLYYEDSGGYRIFGPKCWGNITEVMSVDVHPSDVGVAISALQLMVKEDSK